MITRRKRMFTAITLLVLLVMGTSVCPVKAEGAARQMEALNRGLVAVKTDGGIFVSWRFLGTENACICFVQCVQRRAKTECCACQNHELCR